MLVDLEKDANRTISFRVPVSLFNELQEMKQEAAALQKQLNVQGELSNALARAIRRTRIEINTLKKARARAASSAPLEAAPVAASSPSHP